jgi:hypothetical protein
MEHKAIRPQRVLTRARHGDPDCGNPYLTRVNPGGARWGLVQAGRTVAAVP